PNVSSTDDSAVAANAPSTIGDHCRKRGAVSLHNAASLRATGVVVSIGTSMALAKTEEGQDRHNHDDESDEIDETVHGFLRVPRSILSIDNLPEMAKFQRMAGKRCKRTRASLRQISPCELRAGDAAPSSSCFNPYICSMHTPFRTPR